MRLCVVDFESRTPTVADLQLSLQMMLVVAAAAHRWFLEEKHSVHLTV